MTETVTSPRRQILLDQAQAAHFLNLRPRTLERYRAKKKGPPYIVIENKVRYKEEDLLAWIEKLRVVPGG